MNIAVKFVQWWQEGMHIIRYLSITEQFSSRFKIEDGAFMWIKAPCSLPYFLQESQGVNTWSLSSCRIAVKVNSGSFGWQGFL
jgi:hypothetical protein